MMGMHLGLCDLNLPDYSLCHVTSTIHNPNPSTRALFPHHHSIAHHLTSSLAHWLTGGSLAHWLSGSCDGGIAQNARSTEQ
jgi:hypothetical protein